MFLSFTIYCYVIHLSVANDLKAIDDSGTLLNIEEYRQFVRTHQALLFPAFQMQLALQVRHIRSTIVLHLLLRCISARF